MVLPKKFKQELKKYSFVEQLMIISDALIALAIILFSQKLIETTFGKASASFGLIILSSVAILRIFKKWGPKE